MRDDTDLWRGRSEAFGPASAVGGAVLPYEGRSALQSPDGLPAAVFGADVDGWATSSTPVLVRGLAKILPLAWAGDPTASVRTVETAEIAALAEQMLAAGMHWAGNWRVLELEERRRDSIGSYADALRRAGATRVDCWTYSHEVGLSLVWAGRADAGTASLALHVVPASWVSEPRAGKPVKNIDVRWSWHDVVGLFESNRGFSL